MLRMQSKEGPKNRATGLAPHPLKAPSFQGNNSSTINLVELAEKNGITDLERTAEAEEPRGSDVHQLANRLYDPY